jgi:hypothetical protein
MLYALSLMSGLPSDHGRPLQRTDLKRISPHFPSSCLGDELIGQSVRGASRHARIRPVVLPCAAALPVVVPIGPKRTGSRSPTLWKPGFDGLAREYLQAVQVPFATPLTGALIVSGLEPKVGLSTLGSHRAERTARDTSRKNATRTTVHPFR